MKWQFYFPGKIHAVGQSGGTHLQKKSSQSGQLVVEAVLIMALGLMVVTTISKTLQEKQFVQNLISKPWGKLSGMIECGTWNPCGPGMHPNTRNRNLSLDPRESP